MEFVRRHRPHRFAFRLQPPLDGFPPALSRQRALGIFLAGPHTEDEKAPRWLRNICKYRVTSVTLCYHNSSRGKADDDRACDAALLDHVQRIVYHHSRVTIVGTVPIKRGTFQTAALVPFRIDGELDRKAIRAKPQKMLPDDGRWRKLQAVPQIPVVVNTSASTT